MWVPFLLPFHPLEESILLPHHVDWMPHGLWTDRTKQTEMIYSFCDFLRLTMFACEVERERKEIEKNKERELLM